MPIHVGSGHTLGERGGEQAHTLSISRAADARPLRQGHNAAQRRPRPGQRPGPLGQRGRERVRDRRRTSRRWTRNDLERRRLAGAPEHAAVSRPQLLDRPAGHLPEPDLGGARWHNRTSARSGCSAGNFAPAGWMFCEGQLLPISEYETLFNLIGTTYGGDGQSTFALPDLRGRVPIHFGNGFTLAETGRRRNDHPDDQPDSRALATLCSRPTAPASTKSAGGSVPALQRRPPRSRRTARTRPTTPLAPSSLTSPAEPSRTTTSSPTSASTSSSPSSGSSRRQT